MEINNKRIKINSKLNLLKTIKINSKLNLFKTIKINSKINRLKTIKIYKNSRNKSKSNKCVDKIKDSWNLLKNKIN